MPTKPANRWRQVVTWSLIVIIALALLGQLLLISPLPRWVLVRQAEKYTGMRVTIEQVSVAGAGWGGWSGVEGLRVYSTDFEQPVLEVRHIKLSHTPLWSLLTGTSFQLGGIEIHEPRLRIEKNADGPTNFDPLQQKLRAQSEQPATPMSAGSLQLPRIAVIGGQIVVRRQDAKGGFGPFDLTLAARPQGESAYTGSLTAGGGNADLQIDRLAWTGGIGVEAWRGLEAQVQLTLDAVPAAWLIPDDADDLNILGNYSGEIWLSATAKRPLDRAGELGFSLRADDTAGVLIHRVEGLAWLDVSEKNHARFVIDRSTWTLRDSTANAWGRISAPNDQWQAYGNIKLDRVPLRPILRLAGVADPPRGRLAGDIRMTHPLGQLARSFGDARLTLTESDFANTGLFAAIFNVLNFQLGAAKPTGQGKLVARLEGQRLLIDSLTYANRGLQLRLSGWAEDITTGGDSPIRGYALGSTKPLPDLPIVAQLNDILNVLSQGVTALNISGTLGQPAVEPVSLKAARTTLGQLIRGGRVEQKNQQPKDVIGPGAHYTENQPTAPPPTPGPTPAPQPATK